MGDETWHVVCTPLSSTGIDGVELAIMIVATFGQAVSGQGPGLNIVYMLIVWRVMVSVSVHLLQVHTEHDPIRWESESALTIP